MPQSQPEIQIPASEEILDEVEMIQIHDPGSQRTTIFRAQNGNGQKFVVKEYFRTSRDCRFWEHQLLCQIHASGEVPGVVRLRSHEVVQIPPSNALIRRAVSGYKKEPLRSRVRLVLWDYGQPMVSAKFVNDLLCGFYDIIEGMFSATRSHQCNTLIASEASRLMLKRGILHRDLSAFNMLLYPEWGDTGVEVKMMDGIPPLIHDLLSDVPRCDHIIERDYYTAS